MNHLYLPIYISTYQRRFLKKAEERFQASVRSLCGSTNCFLSLGKVYQGIYLSTHLSKETIRPTQSSSSLLPYPSDLIDITPVKSEIPSLIEKTTCVYKSIFRMAPDHYVGLTEWAKLKLKQIDTNQAAVIVDYYYYSSYLIIVDI